MNKNSVGNRIEYLEKLRVLAIFFVLYCHSGSSCVLSYMQTDILPFKIVSIMIASVTQCCICLFFLISGAVLLKKQESVKSILLHRFLPMLFVTVVVVAFQCVYNIFVYKAQLSFKDVIELIYSGGAITEQWFLYLYLGFLLCLPLLKKLASVMTSEIAGYLVVLMIIYDILVPTFERISDFKHFGINVPIMSTVIVMPLLGHYLENVADEKLYNGKNKLCVGIALSVLIITNTMMNYHSLIHGGRLAYDTFFIGFYALGFFVLFHNKARISKNSFWGFCGAGVFGIYLFERQFRAVVSAAFSFLKGIISDYAYGLVEIVLVMALGIVVVNVVKRIFGKLVAFIKRNQ